MSKHSEKPERRKFLKNIVAVGAGALAVGTSTVIAESTEPAKQKNKIKVLTTEGKVIEVDQPANDCKISPCTPAKGVEARKGIPGRSFVMVIDLARCKNARKCIEGC